MKSTIIFCLFAMVAAAIARPDDTYTDRYDNINLDEILDNKRILNSYSDCMLDRGNCSPEGNELKAHMKEAISNNCAKCTDKQKEGCRKVIKHMINKEPEIWDELVAKYDPKKEYSTKYEKELREILA